MAFLKSLVDKDQVRSFIPMRTVEKFVDQQKIYVDEPIIPSLLFVQSTAAYIEQIKRASGNNVSIYCQPGTAIPSIIPDKEMDIFIFVATKGCRELKAIEKPETKEDRIRVVDGIFKGAEGYIRRVHGTKRLVVVIEGIAAIATSYIPRCFIEKIS